jgi:hypothetical protein
VHDPKKEGESNQLVAPPPERPAGSRLVALPGQTAYHGAIGGNGEGRRVHIHPCLRCEAFSARLSIARTAAPMSFDVSSSPAFVGLDGRVIAQVATNPPLPSISIWCDGLPWPIVIQSWVYGHSWLTVGDVLRGIYDCLRIPLEVGRGESGRSHNHNAATRSPGIQRKTRIDYLEGRHLFQGLGPSGDGDEIWNLYLSRI